LWEQASELNGRHFDSKVNYCMHRWSTGVITDAQINAELAEFVYAVPGKGELLRAALLIAQGTKDQGIDELKEIVDA
jgi:hypothetical protein